MEASMFTSMFKIVGVGGCGVNAVNCMYRKLSKATATFVVCDTDRQSLENSAVPLKLLLGGDGLGAGGSMKKGMNATTVSQNHIEGILYDGTKVVFIIAGMGGGTGSGAALVTPTLAQMKGVFTVGIVTLPFKFEGKDRRDKALDAVASMKLVANEVYVVDNDSLAKNYSELTITDAFKAIDETLCEVVEKVMEAITANGINDVTFAGVRNTLMGKRIIIDNNKL